MTRAKDISKIITDANLSGTLDVTGAVTVGSGSNTTISIDSSSAFDASLTTDGANQAFNIIGTNNSSNGNVYIKTGGTGTPLTRARFNPNGDISFYEDTGTTPKLFWDASAESLLADRASSGYMFETSGGIRAGIRSDDQNNLTLRAGTDAIKMHVGADGNVGIGETDPDSTLTVKGASHTNFQVKSNSESTKAFIQTVQDSDIRIGSSTNHPVSFYQNGNERMRITSGGNVGIGNTNPNSFNSQGNNLVVGTGSGDNGISIYSGSGSGDTGNLFFVDGNTDPHWVRAAITYDHGTDQMKFRVNDANRIEIDSSGKVGIGTSSPGYKLDVDVTGSALRLNSTTSQALLVISSDDSANAKIEFGDESDNDRGAITYDNPNNAMLFQTNTSERMRITSAGNVGIGTSSPSQKLDVNGTIVASTTASQGVRIERNGTTGGANFDSVLASGSLHFRTGSTERMRIVEQSVGGLGHTLGDATVTGTGFNFRSQTNGAHLEVGHASGAGNGFSFFICRRAGTSIGGISQDGTTGVDFDTTSDYRLKENITYNFDATTRLKQLQPCRFNFISEPSRTIDGFLAHEVTDAVPQAVKGQKDEVDEDGNINPQMIDHSKLVPLLVKTIQELEARIVALETA